MWADRHKCPYTDAEADRVQQSLKRTYRCIKFAEGYVVSQPGSFRTLPYIDRLSMIPSDEPASGSTQTVTSTPR